MQILYISVVAFNFVLALLPLIFKPKKLSSYFFSLAAIALSFWTVCVYQLWYQDNHLLFWIRAAFIGPIVAPVAMVMFGLIYPYQRIKNVVPLFMALLVIPVTLLALVFTPMIVNSVDVYRHANYGPAHKIFALYFLTFSIGFLVNLYIGLRRLTGNDKLKLHLLFLGTFAIVFIGGLTNLALPLLGINRLTFLGPLSLTFFYVLNLYGILKYRLLDITLVIRKSVAIVIALLVFVIGYLAIDRFPIPGLAIGYWVVCCLVFDRLRLFIQTTYDKAFLNLSFDYGSSLEHISHELGQCANLDDVQNRLKVFCKDDLDIASAQLYLPSNFDDLQASLLPFINHETQEILEDTTPSDRVIHCKIHDSLNGILVLGHKLSEDRYTNDDRQLFKTLASLVASTLERIRPFEQIKKNYEKSVSVAENMAQQASYMTLTRGIAHEIRNPLGIILSSIEMMLDHLDDKDMVLELAESAKNSILRLRDITRSMLNYASPAGNYSKTNVNEILEDLVVLTAGERKKRTIHLEKELSDVPVIHGDGTGLSQAFLNLLINSLESIDKKGTIRIVTTMGTMVTKEGKTIQAVKIQIGDTGHGIPSDTLSKIFDPFFTTKYGHPGLGMSQVLRTVDGHRGTITIESKLEVGTQVIIWLPTA